MSDVLDVVDTVSVPFKRKLVSIQKVNDIQPIEGADNIERVSILGWNVVSQKNIHKVGDYVAYFEIDSFLPIRDEFEFLRKSSFRFHKDLGEGFRVKTIKLRGQISQGLILPLHEVVNMLADSSEFYARTIPEEGFDLTDLLGVHKWEAPTDDNRFISGDAKGRFPEFIPKTDQERVQNLKNDIKYFPNYIFEATLKLDGTSMTVYVKDGEVGVCSRNLELKDSETSIYWKFVHDSGLYDYLKAYNGNIAIQGELMGPGIQKNREGFKEHRFYVFDVYGIDDQKYLAPNFRESYVMSFVNTVILHVPVIGRIDVENWTVEKFLEFAERPSINHAIAEGVVFKNSANPHLSFKAISNKFLLKNDG